MTVGADAWGRSVSGSGACWQAGPAWRSHKARVACGPMLLLGRGPSGRRGQARVGRVWAESLGRE